MILELFIVIVILIYFVVVSRRPREVGARPSVPDSPLVPPSPSGEYYINDESVKEWFDSMYPGMCGGEED